MAISIYNIFWSLTILATFANSLNYYVRDPSEEVVDISDLTDVAAEGDDDADYLSRDRRHITHTAQGWVGPICWNVSRWGDLKYKNETCEKCKPKFDTVITPRCSDECVNVTHERCSLVASTECKPTDIDDHYWTTDDEYNYFDYNICHDVPKPECHNKTRPKCVDKTAYNCVVGWKMLDNGTKVPDVYKDNCKPETWKECHGHGYETYCAPFVKDTVECDVDFKIPYCQCKKIPVPVKLKKVTCKPKVVAVCEPVTERICSKVCWEDTIQTVATNCVPGMVWKPEQPFIHEERCLLDKEGRHFGSSDDGYHGIHSHGHDHGHGHSTPTYQAPTNTYLQPQPTYYPHPQKVARNAEEPFAPVLGPKSNAQVVYKDNYQWTPDFKH